MNNAKQNAEYWAQDLCALHQAHQKLLSGEESAIAEGTEYHSADEVVDAAMEMPLSVEVSAGYYAPGTEPKPNRFQVLLSTGGPALRIAGDLNNWLEPSGDIRFQVQDWFTPWEDYTPESVGRSDLADALAWVCSCFWFGE